ncbi:hypothetical protein NPIL_340431 [Nephila pilipes]|uniref:Uncharacterized protein n=1 Tax=Nephila pilipes TaxID=299642 RepID=A0A8X6THS4_NEPPI|nr:hypothetical protein NPIL_340431 [Nephila pilipes]
MSIFHGIQRERRRQDELKTLKGKEEVEKRPIDDIPATEATQNPNTEDGQTALKRENRNFKKNGERQRKKWKKRTDRKNYLNIFKVGDEVITR